MMVKNQMNKKNLKKWLSWSAEQLDQMFTQMVEENVEVNEEFIEEFVDSLWLKNMKFTDEEKMNISKFATFMFMNDEMIQEIEKDWTEEEKMMLDEQEDTLREEVWSKYFDKLPKKIKDKWDEMEDEIIDE